MLVFSSALAVLLMGNPAPAAATPDDLRDAIENLDHSQYKVRTAAAKKLLAAGGNAIAPLVKAAETGNIETADRAMKILQELAFNSGKETMVAARNALHKLAGSKAPIGEQAREALKRHRGQLLDKLTEAGARFQFDGDEPRAIYFDAVEELAAVLPLLREFPEVTELSFSTKKFGDAEMKHLLPLTKLKYLNLFESNIGDESLKLLKNFPDLESVPMGHTRATDEGLKHLADLKNLQYIGLRGNSITDAGLVHLKKLTTLTGITLEETKITGASFEQLQGLTKLNSLRLHSTGVTDEALEKLHGLKLLRFVDVKGTKVTKQGVLKLSEAIPEARITITND